MKTKKGGKIDKWAEKHPTLSRIMFGNPCPKCNFAMGIITLNYQQCPNCNYKEEK